MIIHGLQKLTLLDYPEKTACTLFSGGCNFRCPFCHNSTLVLDPTSQEVIDEKELFAFLKKREGLLDGICLTGGEPLINDDIESFLENLRKYDYLIKLDTNGSFPDKLESIINKGLVDYVAMDIKNSKEKYPMTIGIENYDITPILKSVDLLLSGKIEYEFRTTVVKQFHEEKDFIEIGKWLKGASRYYLQAFKDSGDIIGKNLTSHDEKTMKSMQNQVRNYIETVELRGI